MAPVTPVIMRVLRPRCYRTSHAVYGIAKLNIDDKSPCGADPRGLSYTRFHGNFAMMECAHPAIL